MQQTKGSFQNTNQGILSKHIWMSCSQVLLCSSHRVTLSSLFQLSPCGHTKPSLWKYSLFLKWDLKHTLRFPPIFLFVCFPHITSIFYLPMCMQHLLVLNLFLIGGLLVYHAGLVSAVSSFSSVAQSCPTLCDPMNRSTPGLPVHHKLPEFTHTHVHRVSDAIQPSHPLSSPSPPAPNPSQHQSLFQWVSSSN